MMDQNSGLKNDRTGQKNHRSTTTFRPVLSLFQRCCLFRQFSSLAFSIAI